jgi:hypothetical protein
LVWRANAITADAYADAVADTTKPPNPSRCILSGCE